MLAVLVVRLLFLLPWLTLVLMKKEIIKRYTPVATFSALLFTLHGEMAYTQGWLEQKVTITDWLITFVPFTYGSFLVGTIWIFALTYGRIWLYLIVNIAVDAFFAFGLHQFLIVPLGIVKDLKHGPFEVFIAFVIMAVILYVYQLWVDGALLSTEITDKKKGIRERLMYIIRDFK
ncbi:hypothetical protein QA612_16120 [Evansella sp. AB-P1]|uniref:hypothetical protein n=1 Tax=Evansella sp. AB-P1 TaxID=3037653 RepID=UPI00241D249E|nr:hypothetical protein [Evansella sp. AB-P1]MDG5788984.1 hypothetical protein [Evansella sp. AB-P1]